MFRRAVFSALSRANVVTSHTAMILLAILALLLSFATDTASQNATGTASLTTMVRRGGPVADLSVPLVALDPNSQYSLLYSLNSLAGLGPDARVDVEVRQGPPSWHPRRFMPETPTTTFSSACPKRERRR